MAERPVAVHVDADFALHGDKGPALAFADGSRTHAWHGRVVPRWVIEEPTDARILAENIVEVRRCALEHLGWEAFVADAGLALVPTAPAAVTACASPTGTPNSNDARRRTHMNLAEHAPASRRSTTSSANPPSRSSTASRPRATSSSSRSRCFPTPPPHHRKPVPPEGEHLVRGAGGRNPHVLVADPGSCECSLAPGRWVIRRQRERSDAAGFSRSVSNSRVTG